MRTQLHITHMHTNIAGLQQHLPQLAAQLPAMLKEYVDLAGELAGVLPDQFETFVQMKE